MFKILKVTTEDHESKSDRSSFKKVDITFTCPTEDLGHFQHLQEYYKVHVVHDIEGYEKYYQDPINTQILFVPIEGSEWSKIKFLSKSPFELGLISNQFAKGEDALVKVEGLENTYQYTDYVSDCHITRACVVQLLEMMVKMQKPPADIEEPNDALYDEYVNQELAVREFANILKTLFSFWD